MPGSRLLSVVLHGSARGASSDKQSDVDFMLVTNQREAALHVLWTIDGRSVDLFIVSKIELAGLIRNVRSVNNNQFALRAFSTGELLMCDDSEINELRREGQVRWTVGPGKPRGSELFNMKQAATYTKLFLEKCDQRATTDPRWTAIRETRSGVFLIQLVESYCRLQGIWSNAFWVLLKEEDPRYEHLINVIGAFLEVDAEVKTQVLSAFCEEVIEICTVRLANLDGMQSAET